MDSTLISISIQKIQRSTEIAIDAMNTITVRDRAACSINRSLARTESSKVSARPNCVLPHNPRNRVASFASQAGRPRVEETQSQIVGQDLHALHADRLHQ